MTILERDMPITRKQAYMFGTVFEYTYVHKVFKLGLDDHKIQMKREIQLHRAKYIKANKTEVCPIPETVKAIESFVPKPTKLYAASAEGIAEYNRNFYAWAQEIIEGATFKRLYDNVVPGDHILAMKLGEEKRFSLFTLRVIRHTKGTYQFYNLTDHLYDLMGWQLRSASIKPYTGNVKMLPVNTTFVEKPLNREIMILGERLFGKPHAFTYSITEL